MTVKRILSSQKRLKLMQYFISQIASNSLVFPQKTHSTPKNAKEWQDDFKGKIFYSHGKSNCCGVLTSYLGNKTFVVKNKKR